jgi:hypothetical protein
MDVCLLCVLCVIRKTSLRRADHSSRGVLPTVTRRCVRSRNLVDEEAIARAGLQSQRNIKKLLRIKGLYMFRTLLGHPQEAPPKRYLVYCCV